jgi:hypothetical protein
MGPQGIKDSEQDLHRAMVFFILVANLWTTSTFPRVFSDQEDEVDEAEAAGQKKVVRWVSSLIQSPHPSFHLPTLSFHPVPSSLPAVWYGTRTTISFPQTGSVVDPDWFFSDPDPDPTFKMAPDPDPDPTWIFFWYF